MSPAGRRVASFLVFSAALLPLLLLFHDAWRDALGADPVEAIQHRTGIWALNLLFVTLSITPLRRLTGWNPLVRWRRTLGLFAFLYATLHVLTFLWLDLDFRFRELVAEVIERPWITAGMTAWLLLLPLAITSTKGWVRRLGGRRWQLLHRLAYFAAAAGTLHFLLAVKRDLTRPLLYAGILAILLGMRLWWRASGRMKRHTPYRSTYESASRS